MLLIRKETEEDIDDIHIINKEAFKQPHEAEIVDKLRRDCKTFLSFVAEMNSKVVGHILFTPAVIESDHGIVEGLGLAPMAVLPEYQKKGIGSQLVIEGLETAKNKGYPFVIVLGHPDYYPKFGFEIAANYHVRCEWDIPVEAFMIILFDQSMAGEIAGVGKYRSELALELKT